MSDENKALFLEKRAKNLGTVLWALHSSRVGGGATALVTKPIFHPINTVRDTIAWILRRPNASYVGVRERGRLAVQETLEGIDAAMWDHAPIIAKSNEFGLALFGSVGAGVVAGNIGWYGSAGVGVKIGYNQSKNNLRFELFSDLEKVIQAFPVVAQVVATGKVMVYWANHQSGLDQGVRRRTGKALYPFGPVIVESTSQDLFIGISQGLGFPPLDTIYAFATKVGRLTWVHREISLPKFLRQDALLPRLGRAAWQPVHNTLGIARKVVHATCVRAFSSLKRNSQEAP